MLTEARGGREERSGLGLGLGLGLEQGNSGQPHSLLLLSICWESGLWVMEWVGELLFFPPWLLLTPRFMKKTTCLGAREGILPTVRYSQGSRA
jgi:hypothetical protein